MGLLPDNNTLQKHPWRFRYNAALEELRQYTPESIIKIKSTITAWRERKTIRQNQEKLWQLLREKQLGKDYRAIIIFPPSLDWNTQLFQRPQQLALALAKQGAMVFYVEPNIDHNQEPFKPLHERLYLCPVHVATFRILSDPVTYLLSWNSRYSAQFTHPRILYDYLDDISAFEGNQKRIARDHLYLLKNAQYVLATSRKLTNEVRPIRDDVIYSPNGVDYEHFARAAYREFSAPPQDMKTVLEQSNPVIGYYGALARWFDYGLLKVVAGLRPNYQFILVGADHDGTLASEEIWRIKNIHWLGFKPYSELPHYLQYFDITMIPFIIHDVTHATSPIKLFEYMAGEKPVVITPMNESMQYPGVLVGANPSEFAQQLDLALQMREDQNYLGSLRRTALENTWSHRAEDLLSTIEKK